MCESISGPLDMSPLRSANSCIYNTTQKNTQTGLVSVGVPGEVMNELEVVPEIVDPFDVGALVGERRTLSKLAGGCSAADAQCLRKIRDSKQYLAKTKTWEEFCPKYLGMSRKTADRLIHHLEEFGPESFEIMQQLGLTHREYRLLAPQVKDQSLHHAGQAIRLLPENGAQIHAALRSPAAAPRWSRSSARFFSWGPERRIARILRRNCVGPPTL